MNNLTFAICLVIGFFIVLGVGSYLDSNAYKKAIAAGEDPDAAQPNYSGNFMVCYLVFGVLVSIILKGFNLID